MANEIKLKRGSGSNPGTSDLVVGEVALRTDNASLFTKKDDGTIAEIGAAAGVSDGDKGDITVSNSGATFTIDNGAVTAVKIQDDLPVNKLSVNNNHIIVGNSANDGQLRTISGDATIDNTAALTIANGAINNAKVASDAAIAGSKISPQFGSQNITATGNLSLSGGDITITSLLPTINLTDSNNNPDYQITNTNGSLNFKDTTNDATRISIQSSATTIANNLDCGAGVDVTGNITVSGTVDGVDIATLNTFVNTINTSVASNTSKLNTIESGATADQTASEILTLIKTVDGSGSGLDADTLDGISSASFLRSDTNDTMSGNLTVSGTGDFSGKVDFQGDAAIEGGTGYGVFKGYSVNDNHFIVSRGIVANQSTLSITGGHQMTFVEHADGTDEGWYFKSKTTGSYREVARIDGTSQMYLDNNRVLTVADEGSGNGIDADTLDGQEGSYYRNAGNINAGTISDARLPATISSNITGSSASCTGNAATATKLATARSISGVNFDGTGNITLNNSNITNGAGYITSADGGNAATLDGIDSSQFLRSDANDTASGIITLSSSSRDCLNFSANSSEDGRGIAFNGRAALTADYNDGYLRLNQYSEFSNGVYTPLVMRADGGFNVDGTTIISGSGTMAYSRLTGTPTIPTATSQLTNDSGFVTSAGLSTSGGTLTGTLNARSIIPTANGSYDLGSNSARWRNIYTSDLNMSNEGGSNDIDGSWGSYTVQEGSDDLFLINKRNGKKYKFNLTEIKGS